MNDLPFFSQPQNSPSEKVMDKLRPLITERSYPRGYILFNSRQLEQNIYIIKKGIARAYIETGDKEITIWFGQENDILISAQGYVYGKRGYEIMELLENATLYRINLETLRELYHTDIEVCNWARQLIEHEFVRTEQRLISYLSQSASERYTDLIRKQPEILQRVQLQYIASYLGISSEHLSRIRGGRS